MPLKPITPTQFMAIEGETVQLTEPRGAWNISSGFGKPACPLLDKDIQMDLLGEGAASVMNYFSAAILSQSLVSLRRTVTSEAHSIFRFGKHLFLP
jgi:hypothetical protein